VAKYFIVSVKAVGQKSGNHQDLVHSFAWDILSSEPSMWFVEKGLGSSLFRQGRGVYEVELVSSGRNMIPVAASFEGLPGVEALADAGSNMSSIERLARKAQ